MVILHIDEDEPFWFGRKMDAVVARMTAFTGEDRIEPYPCAHVASTERHPIEYLAELVRDRGRGSARIGVEMDDTCHTARWRAILAAEMDGARLLDATLLVNWRRMRKSSREIAYMREAGEIAAAAMRAAVEACAVGARQCDVIAALYKVTIGGTERVGGTFPCKPPNAMVGEMAAAPHPSWTDALLREGDLFHIEQGACGTATARR